MMEQNHNKSFETANASVGEAISWSGSFAQNYDQYLGPFIFGRYAEDLVRRVNPDTVGAVLEIACGTGQLTNRLIDRLNVEARLISTDISLEMMAVAQRKIQASNVTWQKADMCALPFGDRQFDLVMCQFGLMFAVDKLLALKEMARVLHAGGKLLINTWAEIKDNAVFDLFNRVIKQLTGTNPMLSEQGPFFETIVRAFISDSPYGRQSFSKILVALNKFFWMPLTPVPSRSARIKLNQA